jgi:uncharacterized protein (TIGR03435 family)
MFVTVAAVPYAQERHEFEVASIRQVVDGLANNATVGVQINGAQVRIANLSLKDLVGLASEVRVNQVQGPDWINSLRFEIMGKLPDGADQKKVPQMLHALLVERFGMKSHREKKEFPVYAIEVARSGFKLTPTMTEDEAAAIEAAAVEAAGSSAGMVMRYGPDSYFVLDDKGIDIRRLPLSVAADLLTRFVDRPVVDMTGLKAGYDLKIPLTLEDRSTMMIRAGSAAGLVLPPQILAMLDNASTSSLTNGLAQVGLAFQSRRTPLDVVVVDEMRRTPTEN